MQSQYLHCMYILIGHNLCQILKREMGPSHVSLEDLLPCQFLL